MGSQIIKQPNGLYCRFSSYVDSIVFWNATPEQLIEYEVRIFRETLTKEINEIIGKLNREGGSRPHFAKTFEEAMEETKKRTPERYQQILEETKCLE